MAKEGFEKAWLQGLTFNTAKPMKGGGIQKIERGLREEDVLDWADKGDTVVIVAGDGRKHSVAKAVKK